MLALRVWPCVALPLMVTLPVGALGGVLGTNTSVSYTHLTLPTSDPSVDLGGRRIIKTKNTAVLEDRQEPSIRAIRNTY